MQARQQPLKDSAPQHVEQKFKKITFADLRPRLLHILISFSETTNSQVTYTRGMRQHYETPTPTGASQTGFLHNKSSGISPRDWLLASSSIPWKKVPGYLHSWAGSKLRA